jgi:hypothetical protein
VSLLCLKSEYSQYAVMSAIVANLKVGVLSTTKVNLYSCDKVPLPRKLFQVVLRNAHENKLS